MRKMVLNEHVLVHLLCSFVSLGFTAELKAVTLEEAVNLDLSQHVEGSSTALLFIIPDRCHECHMYRKLMGPLHRTHLINAMHQFTTGVQAARLDDSNFEHDTQASTGSTTGSWLVVFDESTSETLQIYDGLALTLRAKFVNLGVLDPKHSTNTAKRFNINIPSDFTDDSSSISLILLKGSAMYRYSKRVYRMDYENIIQFALTDYATHTRNPIPRPHMIFDEIIETLVGFTLKLQNEFGKPVILMLGIIALFSFLVLISLILVIGFWFAGSFEHDYEERVSMTTIAPYEADDNNKPKLVKKSKNE
ncbi:unnamed protein product [Heterobilharzia americana]|nr:unnamed protein product [Heterobilharzia americana]